MKRACMVVVHMLNFAITQNFQNGRCMPPYRWGSVFFLGLPADDMKNDEEKEFIVCLKLNVTVKVDFGKQEFIDSFALIQH